MNKITNPKISVIMGIYNNENTLAEALDSIVKQTYSDWECIMCDDGSTDSTFKIAESYVKKYPDKFILLKNKENKGLNYTLNKCLYKANGEYIARMDGDDISLPDRFYKEFSFLDSHPEFSVVSSEMLMFDADGDFGKTSVIERPEKKDFLKHSPFFCHAAAMIKKDIFLEVGGYTVNPHLLRVEDCHLWFKIYSKGYKGANIPEVLYKMRDDRNAVKRRNIKARMNSIYVMFVGFKMIKMPWYNYIYAVIDAIKTVIKCIIPQSVYTYIHKKKFGF